MIMNIVRSMLVGK